VYSSIEPTITKSIELLKKLQGIFMAPIVASGKCFLISSADSKADLHSIMTSTFFLILILLHL